MALAHVEPEELDAIRAGLLIAPADWLRLQNVWNEEFWPNLRRLANHKRDLHLWMLGGAHLGYARSTRRWWEPAGRLLAERGLADRPVYFVSSNTHSIVNILTGTARRRREELVHFVEEIQHAELLPELRRLQEGG